MICSDYDTDTDSDSDPTLVPEVARSDPKLIKYFTSKCSSPIHITVTGLNSEECLAKIFVPGTNPVLHAINIFAQLHYIHASMITFVIGELRLHRSQSLEQHYRISPPERIYGATWDHLWHVRTDYLDATPHYGTILTAQDKQEIALDDLRILHTFAWTRRRIQVQAIITPPRCTHCEATCETQQAPHTHTKLTKFGHIFPLYPSQYITNIHRLPGLLGHNVHEINQDQARVEEAVDRHLDELAFEVLRVWNKHLMSMPHPLGMETQFRYISLIEDDPLGLNTFHINNMGTTYCSIKCLARHQRTLYNLLPGEAFWTCCRTKPEIPWENISSPHQATPPLSYKSEGIHFSRRRYIAGTPRD